MLGARRVSSSRGGLFVLAEIAIGVGKKPVMRAGIDAALHICTAVGAQIRLRLSSPPRRSPIRLGLAAAIGIWAIAPGTAIARSLQQATMDGDLCTRWAMVAAEEHGVPPRLMHAISLVESQLALAGRAVAWPWAINVDGQGDWFDTRDEARRHLQQALSEGRQSIDIGCFQLNLRWHGDAFAAPDEMLDPARNARYAARFLAALHDELGDWTRATAAYHSRTAAIGTAYVRRVAATLESLDASTDGRLLAAVPSPDPGKRIGRAAVPVMSGPLRAALGAPTGWTRAPPTAAVSGAPLGSLVPAPTTGTGGGAGSAFPPPKP